MERFLPGLAISLGFCCGVASFAHADWPTNPSENLPICQAAGNQLSPRIVTDGSGGSLIAWVDARGGPADVYVQRVSAFGLTVWTTNGVAVCTATGDQFNLALIPDGSGGAIVAWQDQRSGEYDIYAQHILATGVMDSAWPVNGTMLCGAVDIQTLPYAVPDGAGGAIVVWRDQRAGTSDIYAQHVLPNGAVDPAWPMDGRALCGAIGNQESPKVLTDGMGGAVAVWHDFRADTTSDVYAMRVRGSGALDPAWPVDGRAICLANGNQQNPALVADGAGGVFLAWQDARGGSTFDIYAHRLSLGGILDPLWPTDGRLLCGATNSQVFPTMSAGDADGTIVAWGDDRVSSLSSDVYATRVSRGGVVDPAWPADGRAICTASGRQFNISIVGDGYGGAIIGWDDARTGAGTNDIYAHHVSGSGVLDPAWPVTGRPVSQVARNQNANRMIADGSGGVILTWSDSRPGPHNDVYAQRVQANGQLGGVVVAVEPSLEPVHKLALSCANPTTGPGLVVRFTLVTDETAALDLMDTSGRRLGSMEVSGAGSGGRTVDLGRGQRLSPGVYLVRLRQGGLSRTTRVVVCR